MDAPKFEDGSHLFSFVEEALRRRRKPSIHCFVLILEPQSTIEDAIRHATARNSTARLLKDGASLTRLQLRTGEKKDVEHLVRVDGAWLYFVEGESGPLKSSMSTFAGRASPFLKLGFLPSGQVLRLLDGLKSEYESLLVTEGTLCTEGQTFRNWKKSPVKYSSSQMQRMANRDGGKWTSISFRAIADGGEVFHSRLYEHGHLTMYSGNFSEFYSDVLLPYVARTLEYQHSLAGRERLDQKSGPTLHPIAFDLPDRLQMRDLGFLRDAAVRNYAAAVMHAGNPMLMVQVCDKDDGSFYDLYAYDRRIEIVPHQRATSGSLAGLVALVTEVLPRATPSMEKGGAVRA